FFLCFFYSSLLIFACYLVHELPFTAHGHRGIDFSRAFELRPAIEIFLPLLFKSVVRSAFPTAKLVPSQYPVALVLLPCEGGPPPFCQGFEYNLGRNHIEAVFVAP